MQGGKTSHRKPGEPHGGQWEALRARLWARWRANRTPCYHCACPFETAPPNQIEHLVSFQRRPDLAMDESNLVPTHGRCPPPPTGCGLSCNTLAGSNSAERDSRGRSVRFSPEFKARKMAELDARGRKPGPERGNRGSPGKSPAVRPSAIGREWLTPVNDFLVRLIQAGFRVFS